MGQHAAVITTDTTSAETLSLAAVLSNEAAPTGAHDIEIRDGIASIVLRARAHEEGALWNRDDRTGTRAID